MTISTETNKVSYSGATAVTLPYTFKIFTDSDLLVVKRTVAGVETELVLDTDYSVAGAGDDSGGNVVLAASPLTTDTVLIKRDVDFLQETEYPQNDPFPAKSHENALDKLTMLAQQVKEQLSRAPLLPVSATTTGYTMPEPEAGAPIGWNAYGTDLTNNPGMSGISAAVAAAQAAQGLSEDARDASIAAQGLAEDAEDAAVLAQGAAVVAQGLAEDARDAAEAAAAGLNLPSVGAGDAGKMLVVKGTEDGYDLSASVPVDNQDLIDKINLGLAAVQVRQPSCSSVGFLPLTTSYQAWHTCVTGTAELDLVEIVPTSTGSTDGVVYGRFVDKNGTSVDFLVASVVAGGQPKSVGLIPGNDGSVIKLKVAADYGIKATGAVWRADCDDIELLTGLGTGGRPIHANTTLATLHDSAAATGYADKAIIMASNTSATDCSASLAMEGTINTKQTVAGKDGQKTVAETLAQAGKTITGKSSTATGLYYTGFVLPVPFGS